VLLRLLNQTLLFLLLLVCEFLHGVSIFLGLRVGLLGVLVRMVPILLLLFLLSMGLEWFLLVSFRIGMAM